LANEDCVEKLITCILGCEEDIMHHVDPCIIHELKIASKIQDGVMASNILDVAGIHGVLPKIMLIELRKGEKINLLLTMK
jgi:hypothetical protein